LFKKVYGDIAYFLRSSGILSHDIENIVEGLMSDPFWLRRRRKRKKIL
jgi:hypothetical protein